MAKHQFQRGPQTSRYERRYGIGAEGGVPQIGRPGGMNTDAAPSDVPVNDFANLVNARRGGGEAYHVRERGGQLVVNQWAPLHDPTARVYPTLFEYGTPKRAWIAGDGCPDQSTNIGFYIGHYDIDQYPRFQPATWYQSGSDKAQIAGFGGSPFLMVGTALRRFSLLPVPYGTKNIALAGSSQDVPLATFPATCSAMIEFDGMLMVALLNGEIYSYDGKTVRLERADGTNVVQSFGLWRDKLVATYQAGANKISFRDQLGAWSNVAGAVQGCEGNTIVSFHDEVYFVGGTGNIWKYNAGTGISVAHAPAGAVDVHSLAVAFGYLYFGYKLVTVSNRATLGRYDASVWTDVHKDFVVQRNTSIQVRALMFLKNNLVAAVNNSGLIKAHTYLSPGSDTGNATWEEESAGGADIRYFATV